MLNTGRLRQLHSFLIKDNRVLKIFFITIASYLIIDTFILFFIRKPTYTSHEKRKITPEDFPEIIICPDPPINVSAANQRGYITQNIYYKGIDKDNYKINRDLRQISWTGNKSEDVKTVSDSIAIFKSGEDCGGTFKKSIIQFRGNISKQRIEFQLIKSLYPYHTCCKVVPPKLSKSHPINHLYLNYEINSSVLVQSFKVMLAHQVTASIYNLHKGIMLGDKIVSSTNGFRHFKVRIKEEKNMPEDPNYPCIDYRVQGEFSKCFETEMTKQNSKFLNCTPHWMTDNENIWCKGKHRIDANLTFSYYLVFLNDIEEGEANPGKCLVPCKLHRFQVEEIGTRQNNKKGLKIRFEKEVEITKSSLAINTITLLSKIGGFIGINKNFLWLIIFIMSSFSALISHLKVQYQGCQHSSEGRKKSSLSF